MSDTNVLSSEFFFRNFCPFTMLFSLIVIMVKKELFDQLGFDYTLIFGVSDPILFVFLGLQDLNGLLF